MSKFEAMNMVYFVPQKYKCPKCSTVFMWSQSIDAYGIISPLCIKCYEDFIKSNVPVGVKVEEKD
jgi:hypothetical protein